MVLKRADGVCARFLSCFGAAARCCVAIVLPLYCYCIAIALLLCYGIVLLVLLVLLLCIGPMGVPLWL